MEADTGLKLDPEAKYKLWSAACEVPGPNGFKQKQAEYHQVITPYRGELYGTDALNTEIQKHIKGIEKNETPDFNRTLDGIMLFDKVIQIANRSKASREPVFAYDATTKKVVFCRTLQR